MPRASVGRLPVIRATGRSRTTRQRREGEGGREQNRPPLVRHGLPLRGRLAVNAWEIRQGDCREVLRSLDAESVHVVVTSPPYWGLRDYGVAGQLGLEPTPEAYVDSLADVFHEVRRVLRPDGTVWLNLGSTYYGSGGAGGDYNENGIREGQPRYKQRVVDPSTKQATNASADFPAPHRSRNSGRWKPKDLVPIPWLVALELQRQGWWLRSEIIWAKKSAMPESVTDRPTRSHEQVFLLAKSKNYFYDSLAIADPLDRPSEGERSTPARFGGALKFNGAKEQSRLHSGNAY